MNAGLPDVPDALKEGRFAAGNALGEGEAFALASKLDGAGVTVTIERRAHGWYVQPNGPVDVCALAGVCQAEGYDVGFRPAEGFGIRRRPGRFDRG